MTAFFDTIRPLFGGKLTQTQVDGLNVLLAATAGLPLRHRAYLLATTYHECDKKMQPITEYGNRSYFDKYEPGTPIGKTLGNTQKGDGYRFRGRGYVQLTGRGNYARAEREIAGAFVLNQPDRALLPEIAAQILVRGCTEGWFTGKKMSDYSDYLKMRQVVNGTDKTSVIAGYARKFEAALVARDADAPAPIPVIDAVPKPPEPPAEQIRENPVVPIQPPSGGSFISRIIAALAALIPTRQK